MSLIEFAERTIKIRGAPFSLAQRPYLRDVYRNRSRNLVLRCSRQVEKSTFVSNRIIYAAVRIPGIQILYVCPRHEQARIFSHDRLADSVIQSSILRRLLWPHKHPMPVENIQFANGSRFYCRAAFHSADSIRGLSADQLYVDEFQDLAAGALPVLQETLSHSPLAQTILTGTPKMVDNHLEQAFAQSTASAWQVRCAGCDVWHRLDAHVLGPRSLACDRCQTPLDVSHGRWVARNPESTWGAGYWINHTMTAWMPYDRILDRQHTYDAVRFQNEVLGEPTDLGDHVITRAEIEACCEDRSFAVSLEQVPALRRTGLVAGLDWGGGGVSATVLVIGYIERNLTFHVQRFDRWRPGTDAVQVMDEIVRCCGRFGIRNLAADGGGMGRSQNRLLLNALHQHGLQSNLYSIFYSAADQQAVREGALWKWNVDRSASIGTLFGRIKKNLLRFPRVTESDSFLDEFTCVVAAYDDQMRRVRYIKPESSRDDALHATNYAQLMGLRMLGVVHS
jgi:hypothetical protein